MDYKQKKHYWLYILKLEHNKYYVGITAHKDPQVRIDQHISGYMQARWISKHPYIDTVEIIDIGTITREDAEILEQKHTLELMSKYGYNSVRGGRLNYGGRYYRIFDWYFSADQMSSLSTVLFLLGIILLLVLLSKK